METSLKLNGKAAIVTGASKGIGAAIAKKLAANGAAVAVNYSSSPESANRVVAEIEAAGGKALAIQADLSKEADVDRLFDETAKAFGKVDILVNNAGVYEFKPLAEITGEHFHRLFNLNVLGLIRACQKAAAKIGPDGGSIVNIGSVAGVSPVPTASVYCGTKAAVNAITVALAGELGQRKIRVNAVNPGMVLTEGVQAAGIDKSDFRRAIESETPLGRIGQPEDVAGLVAFLVSEEASWITGELYHISGGYR